MTQKRRYANAKRQRQITLCVNDSEIKLFDSAAEKFGMDRSAFLRFSAIALAQDLKVSVPMA